MNIVYTVIIIVAAILGTILSAAGFAGTVVLWLGIFICSLLNGFNTIGAGLLVLFLLLSAVGEASEYLSGMMGAKKYGASKAGIIGALLGGLAGGILFSFLFIGIGTVLGVFFGTFLGAFTGEYISGKGIIASGKAGLGAFIGRVAAVGIKILVILVMTMVSLVKYLTA
ncbi:MAG: DUF456 domain-containing protein [Elusimicrobiota bacterium]